MWQKLMAKLVEKYVIPRLEKWFDDHIQGEGWVPKIPSIAPELQKSIRQYDILGQIPTEELQAELRRRKLAAKKAKTTEDALGGLTATEAQAYLAKNQPNVET